MWCEKAISESMEGQCSQMQWKKIRHKEAILQLPYKGRNQVGILSKIRLIFERFFRGIECKVNKPREDVLHV